MPEDIIRGWKIIIDEETTIDSINLEKIGIICINEDNLDDISFSNEYIYDEDLQKYELNFSIPDQIKFTLKFLITKVGNDAAAAIQDLKATFNTAGKEYTFIRNLNGYPNKFVVDSIATDRYTKKGEFIPFEISASYVGDFREYSVIREIVKFKGSENRFKFDHRFTAPEPSTIFDTELPAEFIKNLKNNTSKILGLRYILSIEEPTYTIEISNETYDETFIVNYDFEIHSEIIIDTESDEPSITASIGGNIINLIEYVDYTVSSLPMLYPGENVIRIDLYNKQGQGVSNALISAEYWNKRV